MLLRLCLLESGFPAHVNQQSSPWLRCTVIYTTLRYPTYEEAHPNVGPGLSHPTPSHCNKGFVWRGHALRNSHLHVHVH